MMGKIFSLVLVLCLVTGCGGDKTTNNYYGAEVPKSSVSSSSVSSSSSSSSSSSAAATEESKEPVSIGTNGLWAQYVPSSSYDIKLNELWIDANQDGKLEEIVIEDDAINSQDEDVYLYSSIGRSGFFADFLKTTKDGQVKRVHTFRLGLYMSKEGTFSLPILFSLRSLGLQQHTFTIRSYTFNGKKYDTYNTIGQINTTSFVVKPPKNTVKIIKETNNDPAVGKLVFSPDENGTEWEVKRIEFDIKMHGTNIPSNDWNKNVFCMSTILTLCQYGSDYVTFPYNIIPEIGTYPIEPYQYMSKTFGMYSLEYNLLFLNKSSEVNSVDISINKVVYTNKLNGYNVWVIYKGLLDSQLTVTQ